MQAPEYTKWTVEFTNGFSTNLTKKEAIEMAKETQRPIPTAIYYRTKKMASVDENEIYWHE